MPKALFAAILGAVLGGALMAVLGAKVTHDLWPAVLVGVLAGVVMRVLAKRPGGSYLNGALAALAVLAAVVGGKYALVTVLKNTKSLQPVPAQVAAAEQGDDEASEEPAPEAVEAPPVEVEPLVLPAEPSVIAPEGFDLSLYDGLYLALGALVAYQIGKGEGGAPAEESTADEAPEPEIAPQPADGGHESATAEQPDQS